MQLNERELYIAREMYDSLSFDYESIENDIKNGYLTINQGRTGRSIMYYYDDANELAVYIDDARILSQEEIEKELL